MAVCDINRILVPEAPPEYEDHNRDYFRNVALTPYLAKFVDDLVESGTYNNASEVVRDGLRELQRRKHADQLTEIRARVGSGLAVVRRVEGDRSIDRAVSSGAHRRPALLRIYPGVPGSRSGASSGHGGRRCVWRRRGRARRGALPDPLDTLLGRTGSFGFAGIRAHAALSRSTISIRSP